eukprot:6484753-Amphidinium_carterae.1
MRQHMMTSQTSQSCNAETVHHKFSSVNLLLGVLLLLWVVWCWMSAVLFAISFATMSSLGERSTVHDK